MVTRRSIWKGSLGFGMVNIPVKLYAGTTDKRKEISLTSIHPECKAQVKSPKTCPACGKSFSADLGNLNELQKAYKVSDDQFIPISDEELASLPLATLKAISVAHFIPGDTLWLDDPRWYKDVYFLSPDGKIGTRALSLFLKAMEELNLVGVAKISMRQREHLILLSPYEGALMMETLHWADELVPYEDLKIEADVSSAELEMAKNLLRAMTKAVRLDEYRDEFREALEALINSKLEGKEIAPLAEAPTVSAGSDLVDALMASLKAVEPAKA